MSQLKMKVLIISTIVAILAFATLSSSFVIRNDIASIRKANADDAEALQKSFASLTPNTKCQVGDMACINKAFAQCAPALAKDGSIVNKYQLFPCNTGLECFALPLVLKRGTSLTCSKYQESYFI
uniref:Carbohydrate-binding module family 19 domain-containing protein n=1 Tax=Rhizophagus clarus TaxID=94130 RepID=A0A140D095_9GLOM|nr:hypothetical protein [Rhizophagus clarus]